VSLDTFDSRTKISCFAAPYQGMRAAGAETHLKLHARLADHRHFQALALARSVRSRELRRKWTGTTSEA
jgi:hypothetical protein